MHNRMRLFVLARYESQHQHQDRHQCRAPATTPLTGSCLCGAIAYALRSTPQAVSHCHCRICQKAHGAAFATYGSVPAKDLVFTRGQEQLRSFASSPGITRCFCQQCGSSLSWHSQHYEEGAWISVALATLDSEFVVGRQRHVNRGAGMAWVDGGTR